MYDWRKFAPEQRQYLLEWRKENSRPWHSPPHQDWGNRAYQLTSACYEHRAIIGMSRKRMSEFEDALLNSLQQSGGVIHAWCVLPNHYHVLVETSDIKKSIHELGLLHGRHSFLWNGEEDTRRRKIFSNCIDRAIRNDRHFWATLNYIHHNSVRHGYVENWQDWPYSSARAFLESIGREEAARIWRKYPVFDYGKGWDDPDL